MQDSGLTPEQVSNVRTGLVAGSGGACCLPGGGGRGQSPPTRASAASGPYLVTRCMSSTVAACLATPFKIKGVSYSISSACATSAHCIGNAMELIQLGKQDVVFAGGADEEHWSHLHDV
jgi:3-oxoacyl-[acyl-carrier-protein] synthase-1